MQQQSVCAYLETGYRKSFWSRNQRNLTGTITNMTSFEFNAREAHVMRLPAMARRVPRLLLLAMAGMRSILIGAVAAVLTFGSPMHAQDVGEAVAVTKAGSVKASTPQASLSHTEVPRTE